jgi:hypothetical protein
MLPTLSRRDYLIRFLQTTVGAWGMGAGLAKTCLYWVACKI